MDRSSIRSTADLKRFDTSPMRRAVFPASPEQACSKMVSTCSDNDSRETAGQIGLVSKLFRTIAEPIELRYIVVSGLKQLKAVVARIDRTNTTSVPDGLQRRRIEVRRLFLSEIAEHHAFTAESDYVAYDFYWPYVPGGTELFHSYADDSAEFWREATALIRRFSTSLESLSLLGSEGWINAVPSGGPPHPKVLGALSGISFPNLTYLAVVHAHTLDFEAFDKEGTEFKSPCTPSLRYLRIANPFYLEERRHREIIHPLLLEMRRDRPELTNLIISDPNLEVSELMRLLFGEDWEARSSRQTLPGKLQSVVMQRSFMPRSPDRIFADSRPEMYLVFLDQFGVDGLKEYAVSPAPTEQGKWRYEMLLAEWKDKGCEFLY
ncbi:hypothetical protein ACEPAF_3064 [Sanghuangporus sanghuang]